MIETGLRPLASIPVIYSPYVDDSKPACVIRLGIGDLRGDIMIFAKDHAHLERTLDAEFLRSMGIEP